MSERQRLISKYTTHLSRATAVHYQLHFLLNEKDEPARNMLIESLEQAASDTNNETIRKAINNAKQSSSGDISFGQSNKNKQNKISKEIQDSHRMGLGGEKKDYKQAGLNQFQSLCLEDALKSFQKHISDIRDRNSKVNYAEKMYKERIEINLVLGDYPEAFSLAQKSKLDDMALVAAITNADFEAARQYIEPNINSIARNTQERNVIATTFEMIHLIIFVLFATETTLETRRLSERLFNSTNFNLDDLKGWTNDFCQRNFAQFLASLPQMQKVFKLSIYTSPVLEKLQTAIIQNVVSLYLSPLARASINSVSAELKLQAPDVVSAAQKSIRNKKLNGKLDLTTNTYTGSIILDNEHNDMKKYFNELIGIRRNFEINLWIREYNTIVRKK